MQPAHPTATAPYTGLELEGRDIYIREGCYTCHSQMIRPFEFEERRYGEASTIADSQFDHPFQWGSKRTGPDLARVGGRYSDAWHLQHMIDPQSVVSESIMPSYAFLAENSVSADQIEDLLAVHRMVGVPYTDDMMVAAKADLRAQGDADSDWDGLIERYPGAAVGNFDGNPRLTEMDALIAYMQMLGTLVDFSTFVADASR